MNILPKVHIPPFYFFHFLLCIFVFFYSSVIIAQQVDLPREIMEKAHCEEIVGPDGKIYSTFGEGRCPLGSKKNFGQQRYACPPGNVQSDYGCAVKRLDAINDTFDAARGALLAAGKAWAGKMYKEHSERLIKHSEMLVKDNYQSIDANDKFETQKIDEPEIGETQITAIGIPMLSKKVGYYTDCVVPHFDFVKKQVGGWTASTQSNAPLCKLKKYKKYIKEKFYYPTYWNVVSKNDAAPVSYPYRVTKKKNKYNLCQTAMGFNTGCSKGRSEDELSFKIGFVIDNDEPFKHLIYAGQFGEIYKFLIIENGNQTEYFVTDPSKDLEISGSLINIISVNEQFIEYKILKYFD